MKIYIIYILSNYVIHFNMSIIDNRLCKFFWNIITPSVIVCQFSDMYLVMQVEISSPR
jgi:hypothetical protein